ncbi:MAG: flagellar export chaperone FliS [Treponema sp.]|nr:flagellar export chaperone FliS [Treponema sp.]
MAYTNVSSVYRETKIKTASQGQLIVMLYDEAVKQLDHSLELMGPKQDSKLEPGKIEAIGKGILKTQEIITELMVSLDFEQGGEIAKNLFSLYTWFNQELLESNITHDNRRVLIVRNLLADLRGAWVDIAKNAGEVKNRPAMGINIAG